MLDVRRNEEKLKAAKTKREFSSSTEGISSASRCYHYNPLLNRINSLPK